MHDENISFERMPARDRWKTLWPLSSATRAWLFTKKGVAIAEERGLILCDTKFEFGQLNGKVILIDEVLTPDSSRFWEKSKYQPGKGQASMDKQYVRDYLERIQWNKQPPVPELPADVVKNTQAKYTEAFERLTGIPFRSLMAKSTLIAVAHKPGVMDPVGHGLKKDIEELGLARVKNVLSAQLFRLEGDVSRQDRERIAKDLLCDPILQECQEHMAPHSLVVDIWFKTGVTDVVGDSVLKGIRDLDIQGVQEVRTGMRYAFEGVTKRDVAEKIATALLVNPLVHDSTIHAD